MAAELTQVSSGRDAKQSSSEENGAVRESFGRGVPQASHPKVDWEGIGSCHVRMVGPPG